MSIRSPRGPPKNDDLYRNGAVRLELTGRGSVPGGSAPFASDGRAHRAIIVVGRQ